MKKVITTAVLIAVAFLAITAGRKYFEPSDAAVNCPTVTKYMNMGFTLDEVFPHAHRYAEKPSGTFDWGTVTVKLHGKTGGEYSLETTYVTVTCYVTCSQKGNKEYFSVSGTDVSEMIVY